jgi:DNA (cytosine-5)-methyltransferase 1
VVLAQLERVFRRNSELDYAHFSDARTGLVLEPMRVILAAWFLSEPFTWVVLEQVPAVLPVWEAYARYLRELGYSVAVGNLHAEQYGVPQTRKRAVLLAYHSTAVTVTLPEPTHSKFHSRTPERLDAGVLPWVSMAQALRYGLSGRPAPTVTGGGTYTGGAEPISHLSRWTERDDWVQRSNYSRGSSDGSTAEERGRTERQADQPSTTVTSKGFQWMRRNSGPGAARTPRLTEDAPSYTIRANGSGMHPSGVEWMDQGEHAARVTVAEAAVLQTFPVGYPWQGGLGKQYQQVGNAIPPLLAKAILQQVV